MSFLTKFKGIPRNLPTGTQPGSGIKPFLMDKGERVFMGAVLGAAKGYYYDKLVFKGVGIEAIVGVVGYLGAALVGGTAGRHLERAGDVGATAYAYALGASWGADRAGRSAAVTAPQLNGKKSVVGVIPPRKDGPFLTPEQMANYASPR